MSGLIVYTGNEIVLLDTTIQSAGASVVENPGLDITSPLEGAAAMTNHLSEHHEKLMS